MTARERIQEEIRDYRRRHPVTRRYFTTGIDYRRRPKKYQTQIAQEDAQFKKQIQALEESQELAPWKVTA